MVTFIHTLSLCTWGRTRLPFSVYPPDAGWLRWWACARHLLRRFQVYNVLTGTSQLMCYPWNLTTRVSFTCTSHCMHCLRALEEKQMATIQSFWCSLSLGNHRLSKAKFLSVGELLALYLKANCSWKQIMENVPLCRHQLNAPIHRELIWQLPSGESNSFSTESRL